MPTTSRQPLPFECLLSCMSYYYYEVRGGGDGDAHAPLSWSCSLVTGRLLVLAHSRRVRLPTVTAPAGLCPPRRRTRSSSTPSEGRTKTQRQTSAYRLEREEGEVGEKGQNYERGNKCARDGGWYLGRWKSCQRRPGGHAPLLVSHSISPSLHSSERICVCD